MLINELSTISSTSRVSASPGSPVGDISLIHACKPHTKDITTIAIDSNGSILATGVSPTDNVLHVGNVLHCNSVYVHTHTLFVSLICTYSVSHLLLMTVYTPAVCVCDTCYNLIEG